jgi:hypothetical protein
MDKKLPSVFVNSKVNNINSNNKSVYYSFKDNKKEVNRKYNSIEIRRKINELFDKSNYNYKVKVNIIYSNGEEKEEIIVSKNYDYLLNINGERILIDNIIDIN